MEDVARTYMYSGMWVADCPRECNNTELITEKLYGSVTRKKEQFYCSYCHYSTYRIDWPKDMDEIESVLMLRPVPHNRNWYPEDHPVAVRFRIPHGQTPDDLRTENEEHGIPIR